MTYQSFVTIHVPDDLYNRLQALSNIRQTNPIYRLESLITAAEQTEQHHDDYLYGMDKA